MFKIMVDIIFSTHMLIFKTPEKGAIRSDKMTETMTH